MFIYKSLLLSILMSLFIYLEYFGLSVKLINTILALSAFLVIFKLNKKELFFSGFLIGIFWFYWISFSFIYYELSYLIPIIILLIAIIYGFLFYLIGLFNNIYYKISYIFLLSFLNPFSFNWFKLELPFINSYLGTSKLEFLLIIIVSAIFIRYRGKLVPILLYSTTIVILSIINSYTVIHTNIQEPSINIYKYETHIAQENKWDRKYKPTIIRNNFKEIKNAIVNKYDLIILPETAFPLILNHQTKIVNELLKYSNNISIITGALYQKDNALYNSTYLFQNGSMQIANKVVLVPFGEAVPLPEKIKDWINNTFYNGANDYITATQPTTFTIKDIKFRNAICYEATTDKIYQDMNNTKYAIAISNNGWFTPSIQPTLQKLLMKYYESKYNIKIIDVSNQ